jgi:outer membrane protein insertion porin family
LHLHVGDAFDPAVLQKDVSALAGLGWFHFSDDPNDKNASVVAHKVDAHGDVDITITLNENPTVTAINFLGIDQPLPPAVVAAEVPWLKVGYPLNTNPAYLARAARRIEQLYKERLGRDVTCSLPNDATPPAVDVRGPDEVVINLRLAGAGAAPAPGGPTAPAGPTPPAPVPGAPAVKPPLAPEANPGPSKPFIPDIRQRIVKVDVRGLAAVARSVVVDKLSTKAGQFFDRDQAERDLAGLRDLGMFYFAGDREQLAGAGYPLPGGSAERGTRIEVLPEPDGKGVTVVFQMVENPVIKAVEIHGNTLVPTARLLEALAYYKIGHVFNLGVEEKEERRLVDAYRTLGYLASVDQGYRPGRILLLSPVAGGIKLTLTMVEYRVGKITYSWGKKTPRTSTRVFRSYMQTRPGVFYNDNTVQDDLREISRLDIVDFNFTPEHLQVDPDDPTKVDLTFDVVEKPTGKVSAGGGISSRYGLVGQTELSENNLWGLAHRASAHLEIGGRFDVDLNYFYPLLDGKGSELTTRLYDTQEDRFVSGFNLFGGGRGSLNQLRRGFQISFSRPVIPTVRAEFSYHLENVVTLRRSTLLPELPPLPFQDLGSDLTSSVETSLTHDTRDFAFDSTKGSMQQGSIEIAGLGGDNHFEKFHVEARNYLPVFGGTVPSGRRQPRPAWVVATRASMWWALGDLPFSQAFFVGGADTLRGYSEDRFFGDRAMLVNVELRRSFQSNIQVVGFFDAGRAWRPGETMCMLKDIASSIGLGVRVTTPLGPLRLDYGWGGEGGHAHFSVGQTF